MIDWKEITSAQINYDTNQRVNTIGFDLTGYNEPTVSNTSPCSMNDDYSIRFFGFENSSLNSFSSITLSNGTIISGGSFNTEQTRNTHSDVICNPVKSVALTSSDRTNSEQLYDLTKAMENVADWNEFKNRKPVDEDEDDIIDVINRFFDCRMGHRGDFDNDEYELQKFPFSITRPIITTDNVALIWELVKE